ncbi:response regulator [Candidatus Albibeggiatoa sp. nov. NOAA]|uniref:response regulator n=1 Tax=Candidatus Albibeggiatoa sp. nov. NOAA TaxID=3162724 RepID=UPI0033026E3D|nr:ATP-binding protein [Thiotrichaceae bacterium]
MTQPTEFEQEETSAQSSSPYVPLRYTLMGAFLLLIIPMMIAMSVFDYLNAKYDLENAYELLQKQTENNILNAIRLVDSGYSVLDQFLSHDMQTKFKPFIKAYERADRDPSKMDLEALKAQLGGKMDLYLINQEGIVEYTTYPQDLNLNFKEKTPEFYKVLQDIFATGRFADGDFGTEARTGVFRKYAYMPTPDRKYVLEFGLVSDEFSRLIGELDLTKITSRLRTINPTLDKVRIFSQHGHVIGSEKGKQASETVVSIVKSVYETKTPYEYYNSQRKSLTRYLFLNLKKENSASDPSKVIELTYNTKLVDQGLERIATFHTFLGIIAILLSILFTFLISAWITYPIRRIVRSVNLIAQGDLYHPIEVKTNNELKLLKQSITIMVNNLLKYMKQVEQQNENLKELDRLKDDFLSNTSHELRTPINGIIGIAESMLDGVAGKLPPKAVENLSMIVFSGRRLANLVNDILDFSKLKHKSIALQIRPIEVKVLADVVITLSQPLIGKKPIELVNSIEQDIIVDADENRVQQILHNLLGNAVKFTDEGQVDVSASQFSEGWLMISVTDTGLGIPREKLSTVFNPFEQADGSISREFGGTGLGLSITKQLVELHGGEIRIQSTEGHGTRVSFTLPLSTTDTAAHGDETETLLERLREPTATPPMLTANVIDIDKDTEKEADEPAIFLDEDTQEIQQIKLDEMLSVLIVDDDPVNLQVLENQLTIENYSVTRALNGPEALEAIDKEKFAVVLLDIMMPKMSGFEVCRIIRERYPVTQLPVIMLTAKNQVADLVQGLESGANDYLTKPFSKGELLARIKTHIQLSRINIAYSHFVPLEFLQLLEKESIVDVRLGDHVQKNMTVLFADIRSFTTLSESLTPKENFDFINEYLGRVSPQIRKYKGFIDKYIGDAIMALFPETVDSAVDAAVEILKHLEILNTERLQRGEKAIKVGVGMHVGSLMLGTIGEEKRMEGTVISDAVNLASRLEGLTKLYGVSILISQDILQNMENPDAHFYRFLGKVIVKGKHEPVQVFELIDAEPDRDIREAKVTLEPEFNAALSLYYQGNFAHAIPLFEHILSVLPVDKAAEFYLGRCRHYIEEGTPEGWEGVEALTEK